MLLFLLRREWHFISVKFNHRLDLGDPRFEVRLHTWPPEYEEPQLLYYDRHRWPRLIEASLGVQLP